MIIAISVLLCLLVLALYLKALTWYYHEDGSSAITTKNETTTEACQHMLSSQPLEARAGPNQRLVEAFGINNAFTTTDYTYRRQFVNNVIRLLRTDDLGWQKFAQSAREALDLTLKSSPDLEFNNGRVGLVHLTQAVAFSTVVTKFFASRTDLELDPESVWWATIMINNLWIESKKVSPRNLKSYQIKLDRAIQSIFGKSNTSGNPLNLILPAYETLWRVVLRLVVEILYRNHGKKDLWQKTLLVFARAPTRASFGSMEPVSSISVEAIIKEGLRLYPPTRRIYRQLQPADTDHKFLMIAADIEYLHRDPVTWGPDALKFDPARWLRLSNTGIRRCQKAQDAFMPFGYGPSACPAKDDAGPIMIGILVAVLVEELGKRRVCVETIERNAKSIGGQGPLKLERDSYIGLLLRMP